MRILILSLLIFSFSGYLSSEDQPKKECCFVNPDYVGVCSVTPAKDETCQSILKYLNTAGTVGKTYCGNSRIRGGWKIVPCDRSEDEQNQTYSSR
jgi:hypothetical protein